MLNRRTHEQASPPTPVQISAAAAWSVAAYLLFGVAFWIMMLLYCVHRQNVGRPSDIDCLHPMWAALGLAGDLVAWPILALDFVMTGSAVAVPDPVVRAVGVGWLASFAFALAWIYRRRPPR